MEILTVGSNCKETMLSLLPDRMVQLGSTLPYQEKLFMSMKINNCMHMYRMMYSGVLIYLMFTYML